ncbi:hypothetical protein B0H15DRAFT_472656 [Mycena belliarum]|uniref:Uncharacterized protein n=1 Tax=Mycena belliarum TaxID=1033014 RepID=A0AAD6XKM0_9AGAR|nr:hypothetical protein B0H15DRAFT_472656 [Mycena belliae]
MSHPYSGAAGYIYANEYPTTPVDAHHNGPYGRMQSFIPIQSVDSLPTLHPYSGKSFAPSNNSHQHTHSQSFDDILHPRVRRESLRRLLPGPVHHPYSQSSQLDMWIDDESVAEPERPTTPNARYRPNRTVPTRAAFLPYGPRALEEGERDKMRLAAAWRRKIQRRVRRALRRLRRFLEGL